MVGFVLIVKVDTLASKSTARNFNVCKLFISAKLQKMLEAQNWWINLANCERLWESNFAKKNILGDRAY